MPDEKESARQTHFTVRQASLVLGISERMVRYYAKRGRFGRVVKLGRNLLIPAGMVPVVYPERLKEEEA